MRRRQFIAYLGGAAAAWPLAAYGQQAKARHIGILETISLAMNSANFDAFRRGLREHGYIEGQNIVIDYRSADGRSERFSGFAAKNATTTIPIVMAAMSDPVGVGADEGLARPGGNITGLAAFSSELEP